MRPYFAAGLQIVGCNHLLVASLLDRERSIAGQHERCIAAANRLAPQARRSGRRPVCQDRHLLIVAVTTGPPKIRPIRFTYGRGSHCFRFDTIALNLDEVLLRTVERQEWSHSAAVAFYFQPVEANQIEDDQHQERKAGIGSSAPTAPAERRSWCR